MTEHEVISVSRCEIEIIPGTKSYSGKPISSKDATATVLGELSTFRVTSSDELNLIVGLVKWPNNEPEVLPIDLIGGLQKHQELSRRGRMSLSLTSDGNWLAVLSVLKYSPTKDRFTLHDGHLDQIDDYLGHSFEELLMEVGALRVGSRRDIDGETSRSANQLAAVVSPGDLRTLAVAYTVTRPLAVINDFGLDL